MEARLTAARELVATAWRSISGAAVTAFASPAPPRPWPLRSRGRVPRDRVWLLDGLLAVVVTVATASTYLQHDRAGQTTVGPVMIAIASLALGLPLLVRDRYPVAAWRATVYVVVVGAAVVAPLYQDVPLYPTHVLAVLLTTYTAVVRAERPIGFGVWVVTMAGIVAIGLVSEGGSGLFTREEWTAVVLATSVPVVLGHNVRVRRGTQAELVAEQRRGDVVRAEQAVLEERARIARELHDVVAHHMTLIAIQAEAGPLRSPGDPHALTADLGTIRSTALTALIETRRILGVLRADPADVSSAPAPGLSQLEDLAAAARAAGHLVDLEHPDDAAVSPGVALSVHRIVQECLSNALRHAPGAAIDIRVRRASGPNRTIEVAVTNGPATTSVDASTYGSGGHGLLGMRERVAMLGGSLQVGPLPDGGYRVHATLPEDAP